MDYDRGLLWQVDGLGAEGYAKWVQEPSTRTSFSLTGCEFAELFTRQPWYAVPLVWIPVVVWALASAMWMTDGGALDSIGSVLVYGAVGVVAWSWLEYSIHRFLFHGAHWRASGRWGIRAQFLLHGQHHKFPQDRHRLVFPPLVSLLVGGALYLAMRLALPEPAALAMFAGTGAGYIVYDMCHYYMHHGRPSEGGYFAWAAAAHRKHHYGDATHNYGITTGAWDVLLGTRAPLRLLRSASAAF